MKRFFITLLLVAIGTSIMAQQKIQLRTADKAQCVKSDKRLKLLFPSQASMLMT